MSQNMSVVILIWLNLVRSSGSQNMELTPGIQRPWANGRASNVDGSHAPGSYLDTTAI